jgi:hypothetical protein
MKYDTARDLVSTCSVSSKDIFVAVREKWRRRRSQESGVRRKSIGVKKMGLKIEHKPVFQAPCNAYPIQFK